MSGNPAPARRPGVIQALERGAELDDVRATAAKLWLEANGSVADPDGGLLQRVRDFWSGRPGGDPYWDFLGRRGACATCGDVHKYENLSICPNCLKTFCYRHRGTCDCGFHTVG